MTRMSQSEILRRLSDMRDTVTEMPDDAKVVPKEFKEKVRTVEDDLWDVDNRGSFPGARTTRDTFSIPDIIKAVATSGGLPHVYVAKNIMFVRRFRTKDETFIEYDYRVCDECKESTQFAFMRNCMKPEDVMDEFIKGFRVNTNVAILLIWVFYITEETENIRCPASGDGHHANMLFVDRTKKKAFIFDPNGIIHKQATFYMDTFAPMALRKLKQKWDIQSIDLERSAVCSYKHGGLCKYANILTYLFPETRTSAKAFAKKVVSVLEHVYMIKGRLRESRSDAVDGPSDAPSATEPSTRAGPSQRSKLPAHAGGGTKRHRKVLRDNVQGITKPAIRRLARRGGVKRVSGLIYEETRGVLKVFLENVIRDSVTYTEHARRKTVSAMDVVYALKRQGRVLYGFGG